MPTFTLNGTAIELEPQTRESFAWLAGQVYRRLHEGPPLPAILTVFAHEGTTTQGLPTNDARIQAILWTLWQIGIASALRLERFHKPGGREYRTHRRDPRYIGEGGEQAG